MNRSPSVVSVRLPAEYGRHRLQQIASRALMGLAFLIAVAVVVGLSAGWTSVTFMVAEAAALAGLLVADRWLAPQLERRERGNDGEIKVAGVLDGLRESGWRTLHDVQTGHGNIDHVVIGPAGILTIETKSRRGRVAVDQIDRAWLRQAYAQRKWLERVTGETVDPLLVFSDAFLDRMVSRHRGVCVLPARALAGHLARRPQRLSSEQVESLHARLAYALSA